MEREEKNEITSSEPEIVLHWGKRLRCVRVKNPNFSSKSTGGIRQKITSRIVTVTATDPSFSALNNRSSENVKLPEKEERYYTRESGKSNMAAENVNVNGIGIGLQEKGNMTMVLPKLYVSLSSKEKEEDFMAKKGCKLPQRPKKRAKFIQRTLHLVSPGAWLSDMCQERYEVREKKTPKKRPRGLKAMGTGSMDSDSD